MIRDAEYVCRRGKWWLQAWRGEHLLAGRCTEKRTLRIHAVELAEDRLYVEGVEGSRGGQGALLMANLGVLVSSRDPLDFGIIVEEQSKVSTRPFTELEWKE